VAKNITKKIGGMSCAACAARIEKQLSKMDGMMQGKMMLISSSCQRNELLQQNHL